MGNATTIMDFINFYHLAL